jgi:histidyl-tRNA synthetase
VVIPDPKFHKKAMSIVSQLRDANLGPVEYPFAPVKVGKQFHAAEERGAKFAIVVDEETIVSGKVGAKNLATRQQEPVLVEDLITWLRSQL